MIMHHYHPHPPKKLKSCAPASTTHVHSLRTMDLLKKCKYKLYIGLYYFVTVLSKIGLCICITWIWITRKATQE